MMAADTRSRLSTRTLVLAGAVVIVVVIAIVLLITGLRGGGLSPRDAALKATANRYLPALSDARRRLPVTDASLRSWQAWVYDTQPVYHRLVRAHGAQLVQLVMIDPNPFPPQSRVLTLPGKPTILVDGSLLRASSKSGKGEFTTVQLGKVRYRVYVAPLPTPKVLVSSGSYAVLEVAQPS